MDRLGNSNDIRPLRKTGSGRGLAGRLRALLLGAGLGLALPAMALESGPLIQGSYEIEAWFIFSYGPPANTGCMIVGNNTALAPSAYQWPAGGDYCGSATLNGQATWNIYPIVSGEKVRHVIKSSTNGQCLIRGSGGQAASPSLYLWQDSADKQYCGLPSADAFIANGQAAWDFTGLETKVHEAGGIVYAGQVRLGGASLGFTAAYDRRRCQIFRWRIFQPCPTSRRAGA